LLVKTHQTAIAADFEARSAETARAGMSLRATAAKRSLCPAMDLPPPRKGMIQGIKQPRVTSTGELLQNATRASLPRHDPLEL
jgi:hypothetical protein